MSIAKVIEISSESPEGFDDAIRKGIAEAGTTVQGICNAWVQDQEVTVKDNRIVTYRVKLKITFALER